jgi:hypothetical protein
VEITKMRNEGTMRRRSEEMGRRRERLMRMKMSTKRIADVTMERLKLCY